MWNENDERDADRLDRLTTTSIIIGMLLVLVGITGSVIMEAVRACF